MKRTLFLDTETTGLRASESGIVELSIVDQAGEVVLQSLVNPWPYKAWAVAESIHGITPEMVRYAPMIHDLWPAIFKIVQGSQLVIYNADYDRQYFPNGALGYCEIECAMQRFGRVQGVRSSHPNGGYKWWKLTEAAEVAGHDWSGQKAHRATADALAARAVWNYCNTKEGL